MRLNTQQKITVMALVLLFLVAIGAGAYLNFQPEVGGTNPIALSTSTSTPVPSSTGWWDAIPTAPALPEIPNNSKATLTPSTP